jgi:CubicO group peptidase (beta-lactamase class C family)
VNLEAAAEYAERHALHALFVQQGRHMSLIRYGEGYDARRAHAIYSGTKSFWGPLAVAAQDDGLCELDELVSHTVPQWAEDPLKAKVTLRELLQLTSGIGFGGLGALVPTFEKALAVRLKDEPGTRFTYGGIALQVFGAVLSRKLAHRKISPQDYLRKRIFEPIGLQIESWRTLEDGTQPLPTGAFVTAREWLKFGRFICGGGTWKGASVLAASSLARCFEGSLPNPRYGLCWWLSPLPPVPDLVYASGSGGQALYVIPSLDTVIVKFGKSASYKHETFLRRLLVTDRSESAASRAPDAAV